MMPVTSLIASALPSLYLEKKRRQMKKKKTTTSTNHPLGFQQDLKKIIVVFLWLETTLLQDAQEHTFEMFARSQTLVCKRMRHVWEEKQNRNERLHTQSATNTKN